jgi:hypothetical protein
MKSVGLQPLDGTILQDKLRQMAVVEPRDVFEPTVDQVQADLRTHVPQIESTRDHGTAQPDTVGTRIIHQTSQHDGAENSRPYDPVSIVFCWSRAFIP